MRIRFIAVCLTLATGHAAAAPLPSTPPSPLLSLPWTRTRPLSSGALALIEAAAARSAIVQTLLDDLERTDVVVYIADSMPGAVVGPKSAMTLVSAATATRYLMVRIDSMRLPLQERMAALGHELYHALEVAAAPEVKDNAGLARLYRRIGWETSAGRFESPGAQNATFQIGLQLRRGEKALRIAQVEDANPPRAAGGPSQN